MERDPDLQSLEDNQWLNDFGCFVAPSFPFILSLF